MAGRQWTDDLAVGVADIDRQHKELFTRLGGLLDAMAAGKAQTQAPAMLDFLARYVREHFATEERHMAAMSYPSANSHKLQHQAFIHEFQLIQRQFQAQGASPTLVLEVHRKVSDWLVNHICRTDKLLGAFLSRGAAGASQASGR
jgi:hemerythrin